MRVKFLSFGVKKLNGTPEQPDTAAQIIIMRFSRLVGYLHTNYLILEGVIGLRVGGYELRGWRKNS